MKINKTILALTCLICCSTLMCTSLHARHHKHHDTDKTTGEKVDAAIDYSKEKTQDAKDKLTDAKSSVKETVDNALSE